MLAAVRNAILLSAHSALTGAVRLVDHEPTQQQEQVMLTA